MLKADASEETADIGTRRRYKDGIDTMHRNPKIGIAEFS